MKNKKALGSSPLSMCQGDNGQEAIQFLCNRCNKPIPEPGRYRLDGECDCPPEGYGRAFMAQPKWKYCPHCGKELS